MSTGMIEKLTEITGLEIYAASISEAGVCTYFLARRDLEKFVGCVGEPCPPNIQKVGEIDGKCVCVGPTDHANARALRKALPWTAPMRVGLKTSAGLGDRLGLATPGHIRAMGAEGGPLVPFLAQQSIREMARTQRTPDEVMDAATWGVLQEGYRGGFGSDADHLQSPEDIDVTVAAGFTMFTIDPGAHVDDEADSLDAAELAARYEKLDFAGLHTTADELQLRYEGRTMKLDGGMSVTFDGESFLRAAVKYGNAIAHTAAMNTHLKNVAVDEFELEVSVDETESPTSTGEHYFFAAELKRLGVRWVSLAPRFVGRMEKGVDYIGDIETFRESFAAHVAVMRTLGPYKLSIHSGSDKFSIYPIGAEMTGGLVHLKTAGTSYLEAVRAIGLIDPPLFREIYEFARANYETDKATYHVSADLAKVPPSDTLSDDELPGLMDQFDARQVLHVTFGSVLTADDGEKFRRRMFEELKRDEETHYAALAKHLGRHVAPFAAK